MLNNFTEMITLIKECQEKVAKEIKEFINGIKDRGDIDNAIFKYIEIYNYNRLAIYFKGLEKQYRKYNRCELNKQDLQKILTIKSFYPIINKVQWEDTSMFADKFTHKDFTKYFKKRLDKN